MRDEHIAEMRAIARKGIVKVSESNGRMYVNAD